MKRITLLVLISMFMNLTGCMIVRSDYEATFREVKLSNNEKILILKEEPKRPYKKLGTIKIQTTNTTPQINIDHELARTAKSLGADAVFNIQGAPDGTVRDTKDKTLLDVKPLDKLHRRFVTGIAIVFLD